MKKKNSEHYSLRSFQHRSKATFKKILVHFSSKENVDTNFFLMVESLLIIGAGAGRNKNLEPEPRLRTDRLRNTGYYQCCRELQTSTVSSSSSSFIYSTIRKV